MVAQILRLRVRNHIFLSWRIARRGSDVPFALDAIPQASLGNTITGTMSVEYISVATL